jgi:hypothetical protein
MKPNRRNWQLIHRFEIKDRTALFKKLSPQDTFNIFSGLCEFGYKLAGRAYFNQLDADRINNLSRIRSIFNKVKT